jgi:hypothetical protein
MTGRPERVPLLADADSDILGERFPFFQDLLTSEAADAPFWEAIDVSDKVAPRDGGRPLGRGLVRHLPHPPGRRLPPSLAGGAAAAAAHRRPLGHTSLGWLGPVLRGTLRLSNTELRGFPGQPPEQPVRVHLGGADEWLDLPDWPPPAETRRLHLNSSGGLRDESPLASQLDRYRYDPRNPDPCRRRELRLRLRIARQLQARSASRRPHLHHRPLAERQLNQLTTLYTAGLGVSDPLCRHDRKGASCLRRPRPRPTS